MLPRAERPTPPLPPSACTHVPHLTARPYSTGGVSTCYPKGSGTLRAHDAIADALEASAAGARSGAPARWPWRWGAAASTVRSEFSTNLFLGG